jgi:prepilin-type N-terminal cleavage/methylation domain-containing protein
MFAVMTFNSGKLKKGFTLVELMVVLFIIGILSVVAIPYMHGRTDASKWSEGKAMAGTVHTAIRTLHAELGPTYPYGTVTTLRQLGFAEGDLTGKYFVDNDFDFEIKDGNPLTYTITVTAGGAAEHPTVPGSITLDQGGTFTEIP